MEDAREHRARSARDRDFADDLSSRDPRTDWELVVCFYAALHLTQAYLLTKDQRFEAKRHDERRKAIKASPELTRGNRFPLAYRWLQDVSEQVRYDPGFRAQLTHFTAAHDKLSIVRSFLEGKLTRALGS